MFVLTISGICCQPVAWI